MVNEVHHRCEITGFTEIKVARFLLSVNTHVFHLPHGPLGYRGYNYYKEIKEVFKKFYEIIFEVLSNNNFKRYIFPGTWRG